MSRQPPAKRQKRLQEIAREVGAVLGDGFDPTPLTPLGQPPTFMVLDDERKADEILGRLREESSSKSSGRRITSFGRKTDQAVYSYTELYLGMVRVIEENGPPGVLEAILRRFKAMDGDINFSKRGSTSALKRVRGREEQDERGRLLLWATERNRVDFVQMLVPHADEQSLTAALDPALGKRFMPVIELLIRYGADTARYEPTLINVVKHGDYSLLDLLLHSRKRVSQQCLDRSLLPAAVAPKGALICLLLLVWAGANTDFDGASALMRAVEAEKVDLATALLAAPKPPRGESVDKALGFMFSQPATPAPSSNGQYSLMEALLCGGPAGDAAAQALLRATILSNTDMMHLLLSHHVDINYKKACAVGHAIERNRSDLLGTLLQGQRLDSEIASELVHSIPTKLAPGDRTVILSKLLIHGASGMYCSEQLILAVESNDIDTARLLVTYGSSNHGSRVCSVNYNRARCLTSAIARNNIEMVKLLAIEGDASKASLALGFTAIPPNVNGDDRFLIVQTLLRGGATGDEVDEALHNAVMSHRKAHRLIQVLVEFKANVKEETLLAAISKGSTTMLDLLLVGNIKPSICATGITIAMKLPMAEDRLKIIEKLLGPATDSNADVPEVSQAVVDILESCPEDVELLELLCRQGKANINYKDGLPVVLATKHPNFALLTTVLGPGTLLPTATTIERAINCAGDLPQSDANRHRKVQALTLKVKPQGAINKALIQEINSALKQGQYSPAIKSYFDAGADVNAEDGLALRLAVSNPQLMNLLLSRKPNIHSLSRAFPSALSLKDPARLSLCEALLQMGATGDDINKALCIVVQEGLPAMSLLRLILPRADINYNNGHALALAVQKYFIEGVDLLLNPVALAPTTLPATRTRALQEAMKLANPEQRHQMVKKLLVAGIEREAASDALIIAAKLQDPLLSQTLMSGGGSSDYKGGQAVRNAAAAGNAKLLRCLVFSQPSMQTLFAGFHGALSLNTDAYYEILQILLEAGMRGEAVDNALIENVKQGDSNLKMTELLCKNGASVEWKEGEAIVLAAASAMLQSLDLLLERKPSQVVLRRAYTAALALSKEQLLPVIERLLKAGKEVDGDVKRSLTLATMEAPSDRQMIKMLLDRGIFDDGEAMGYAAQHLDLRTLSMLLSSPEAAERVSAAFEAIEISHDLLTSATGLAVVKLLLEKGADGQHVSELLYQAVVSLEEIPERTSNLADQFIDVCLNSGASTNNQRGLALQRATLQANIPLIAKLLPGASPESKAMAMPYVFTVCEDKAAVLQALASFSDSFDGEGESLDIRFRHPDDTLMPVLFLALQRFPRDTQILKFLLDMGYSANQWHFFAGESENEPEKWPILCWALEQPEKRISTSVIEMLIDAGADVNFTSKSGMTPLWLAIQNQRVDIVSKLVSRGVDVAIEDSEGITPLSLASSMNNMALMDCILEAGAERDDGSLHDVSAELKMDRMRLLIKHKHSVNYPSDRHDGRSALAELCLKAVDHDPTAKQLEKGIQLLRESDARIIKKSVSGKTMFHYALDSSNPVLILSAMLKIFWEHVNNDAFLYIGKEYTYSLTKYVEKDLFKGPRNQKKEILELLRRKDALDRFWAQDIMAIQPDDYCNGPPHIEEEVIRQKQRLKRQAEMREETHHALELKRLAVVGEAEVLQLKAQSEYERMQEKARVERELMEASAITQLRITEDSWQQTSRLQEEARMQDLHHQRQLGDVQLSVARRIKEESIEADRSRNMMQIEYLDKKIEMENGGYRSRLMIEEQGAESMSRVNQKDHEREVARMRMQKQLLGQQQTLASQFGSFSSGHGNASGSGYIPPGQRQIGFISEVPN